MNQCVSLTKLGTKHSWLKGIQVFQMKGHAILQGGIITKRKYIDEIYKNLLRKNHKGPLFFYKGG